MRLKNLFFCQPTCPRNSKPTRPGSLAGLRVLEVSRFRRPTCPRNLAFPPTYLSSQSCVSADLLVLVILRFCQPTCPRKPGRLTPSQGLPSYMRVKPKQSLIKPETPPLQPARWEMVVYCSWAMLNPHYPREKKGSFLLKYKEPHTPKSIKDP